MESNSPINKNDKLSKKYIIESSIKKNKKRKKKNNKIANFIKNPSITHFNIDSNFIYSEEEFLEYYKLIQNKNSIKLNNEEIYFLANKIEEINIASNFDKKMILLN